MRYRDSSSFSDPIIDTEHVAGFMTRGPDYLGDSKLLVQEKILWMIMTVHVVTDLTEMD